MKYTFIHPTKCGGTSVEQYFQNNYSQYINAGGHGNKALNNNNPIIIVRDVKSRFISMFNYWKKGAIDTRFKRSKEFINKVKTVTILDFIELLKNNKQSLYVDFTWNVHFQQTTQWINCNYDKLIVIKYENDLNNKINELINYLNINNKNIILEKKNITQKPNNNDIYLFESKEVNEFIEEYFKDDIKLLDDINNNPELFKFVI